MSANSFLHKHLYPQSPVIDTEPLLVYPRTLITEAIKQMSRCRTSCALVVEKQRLVGIFTERDIVRMSAELMTLENLEVQQIMTQDPIAISVTQEHDIFAVLALLRQHRVRHLPAIDEEGKPIGVITPRSIREILQPTDLLKLIPVHQVMNPNVIHAPPTDSVLEIIKKMAKHQISCVTIALSSDCSEVIPIGIITERDIVQFRALGLNLAAIKASAVMSSPLLPIKPEDSLWNAHQVMNQHHIRRLVVVDEARKLAGIITQSSLLEALDPAEMYVTIEILRQQVDERTAQLTEANDRLQDEIARREGELRDRITLEKQLSDRNAQLQQALLKAEAASIVKSTFLANMSHELRTPLHAILGFTQLMSRSGSISGEDRGYLDIVRRSGEHLLNLIDNLLNVSRIEAGLTTLHTEDFDLHLLLHDLADLFQHRAREKHLHFILKTTPDLPQQIDSDRVKLRHILINLLENALDLTESGTVTLCVGIARDRSLMAYRPKNTATPEPFAGNPERLALTFEISHTISAIARDRLDQLFQADIGSKISNQLFKKTDLGLSVSRFFIELMGGEITLHILSNRTTFTFDIPVRILHSRTPPHTLTRRIIALEPNQAPYRILVVDDQWENRELCLKLLSPLGFEVREATNGQEAVAVWDDWEPHLIFMDMRMPVMNGYEAIKHIKKTLKGQATAVIIALTVSPIDAGGSIAAANCDDFIRKPFREADIFDKIIKHLGVRFIFEEPPDSESKEQSGQLGDRIGLAQSDSTIQDVLNPDALAALPEPLIADLEQATLRINLELVYHILAEIRTHNRALAEALTTLIDDFNYNPVLNLIQEAKLRNE